MGMIIVGGILLTFAFLLMVPLGFVAVAFERSRKSVRDGTTEKSAS